MIPKSQIYKLDIPDNIGNTPNEYLAALRVLHAVQRQIVKERGFIDNNVLAAIKVLELRCPWYLKNVVNLLYNSDSKEK